MTATMDPWRLAAPLAVIAAAVPIGLLAGTDPLMAVAGALAIGFVLLVFADLAIGVVAFTVLTFLGLLPTLGGPALSLPKVAGALLAISWLATIAVRQRSVADFFSEQQAVAGIALTFMGWVILSTIWAESHSAALSASTRYALTIALLPIVYTAMRGRHSAALVAGAFLAGATVAAAYGLASPPETGLAAGSDVDRLAGTIGDPNELAALLVAGLVLGAALARYVSSPAIRLLAVSASALCTFTLLLTLSRGGLLAMGAALLAGMVIGGRRLRPTFALATLAVVTTAVLYLGFVAPPEAKQRLTEADGGTGRTDIWKVAWRTVEAHPVNGVGADNFSVASPRFVLQPGALERADLVIERREVTHNMYLQVLSELGVIGLALFIALILVCLRAAMRAARIFGSIGDAPMEVLSRALVVALLGLLAADIFLSGQFSKQLWLLLALAPALHGVALREEQEPEPPFSGA